jgi:hypothetical protein
MRYGSPGNLPSQKVNGGPNLRMQKGDLFSVEERPASKRGSISFVPVQCFPHGFTEDTINFDRHPPRLLEDSRIPFLAEKKTPQHTVRVKPKISKDKESLSRQASAAQGTVDGQKGCIRGCHAADYRVPRGPRLKIVLWPSGRYRRTPDRDCGVRQRLGSNIRALLGC